MRKILIIIGLAFSITASAQYNVDRVIMSGRSALYYEDYVLSIQYFSNVLALKPYLWEPWHLRGVAKYSLEDFAGAETDASQSLLLNPYIPQAYELRAIARIRQDKFEGAISDYTQAIRLDPSRKEYWYNRAICRIESKEYDKASLEIDTLVQKWEKYLPSYLLKADVMLRQKDTLKAATWVDKALELEPFNPEAWRMRAHLYSWAEEWKHADEAYSKVLKTKPKQVDCYLNRAVARLKLNNLRGAMQDYDFALEFDPTNFLGHYNRGLLRQQVGDDNRAIEDFNFVLSLEPENYLALFNRATLLDRTGDLKAAIRDYTKVIDEFPNFWTGLHYRAGCYRRLGMTAKAEQDEFRILKAQMDKHLGKQARWSRKKVSDVRKKSDIDPNKYNQLVVEDDMQKDPEYKSDYRGRVQNRRVEEDYQQYLVLSTQKYFNALNSHKPYSSDVDQLNMLLGAKSANLHISTMPRQLPADDVKRTFALVDSLTAQMNATKDTERAKALLLVRCAANTITQNYQDAISDADLYLSLDSTNINKGIEAAVLCQRAVCNARLMNFEMDMKDSPSGGKESSYAANLRVAGILSDFSRAEALDATNANIFYSRGTFHAERREYDKALDYLSRAIAIDPLLPEAYYNRGIVYLKQGDKEKGITDLGKAGELGLYNAYSIIKANRSSK